MKSIITFSAVVFLVLAAAPPIFATDPPDREIKAAIEALLGDDHDAARRGHLFLVSRAEEAAPEVRSRLAETSGENAVRLIMLLTRIDDPGSADLLREKWETSPYTEVRLAAAMALCRLDVEFERFLAYIAGQAREGDEAKRLEAMQMLGYIGDARVVPLLRSIFYDQAQTDYVRQAAIWDLAHTPVPDSVHVLVEIVSDPDVDWFYKEIVLAALRHLAQNEELVPVITEELERIQRLPLHRAPTGQ